MNDTLLRCVFRNTGAAAPQKHEIKRFVFLVSGYGASIFINPILSRLQ
jgi:hypothetical protein